MPPHVLGKEEQRQRPRAYVRAGDRLVLHRQELGVRAGFPDQPFQRFRVLFTVRMRDADQLLFVGVDLLPQRVRQIADGLFSAAHLARYDDAAQFVKVDAAILVHGSGDSDPAAFK